ncbi:MAG: TolC family protein [Fluviicola sp.]|nr:TolC family protein [Fluviicola sp.]
MKQLKHYFFSIIGLLVVSSMAHSQSKLDGYIAEGLANNSVLQQKQIDLEKAMIALRIAKSNYLPTVNFSGTFSTAKGGRYSDLPVGDLLNPVYATLNQLTGSSSFPQIENQQIDFLPKNYYDAYVRTAVPIVNTDIIYNKRIEEQKTVLTQLDLNLYARQLVNDIKVAYFNYQSSVQAIEIYKKALTTLEKNIAMNEALIANGKGLNIHLMRVKSEWETTNAQLIQAENQQRNAQVYFNFLLNKDLSSPIENELVVADASTTTTDVSKREEINLLEQSKSIQQTVLRMNELFWVPKLNAFLDLGSQGVDWEVSSKSTYYMVGVSLSIPIFNGTRNTQKVKLSEWNLKQADLAIQQTTQQLSLSVQLALNALSTATANYESSLKQLATAQEYFHLIEDAQKQGVASEIEFIDAANQLTQAELQVSLLQQQINSAVANLERETATYPIETTQKTN